MQGKIYLIENKINHKKYIGKTIFSVEERWKQHKNDFNKERNKDRPLYKAFKKYGIENFIFSIIEECDLQILSEREMYWIKYYDSFHNGYNATLGGDGKSFLDYQLIIDTFLKNNCIKDTAEELHCSESSVRKILKENNINYSGKENMARKLGHAVIAYDLKGNFIKKFESQSDAARWIIEQKLSSINDTKKISYFIGRVARRLDKRKSSFGYVWRYPEDTFE